MNRACQTKDPITEDGGGLPGTERGGINWYRKGRLPGIEREVYLV